MLNISLLINSSPNNVSFATLPRFPPQPKPLPENKPATIKAFQKLLCHAGYKCKVDGVFGSETEEKLKKFKKEVLKIKKPDNEIESGLKSWKKLLKIIK